MLTLDVSPPRRIPCISSSNLPPTNGCKVIRAYFDLTTMSALSLDLNIDVHATTAYQSVLGSRETYHERNMA